MQQPTDPAPPATDRVRIRRKPDRGRYDRATIDAILDEAVVGHVGYVIEGQPFVTPTCIWRTGDRLYWHGSAASRGIRSAGDGGPVCVTVSLLDGLVLARSGFDHSVNFRSVMVLGQAYVVEDEAEKLTALDAFIDHLYPGRSAELRPATPKELKATGVAWMDLAEASAKVRSDDVHDEPGDETWPVWAGVVPIRLAYGKPEPDGFVPEGMEVPGYVRRSRGRPTDPAD